MDFAELVAPLAPDQFLNDYWGRRPVHLAAPPGSRRAAVIGWERLNALLAIRAHWSAEHIKLLLNSAPITPDFYMEPDPGTGRLLADPARVETFLAMGASLVADRIELVAPEIHALTAALAERFAARAGANLYCSFGGIQAFASHCDTHEVFAIHCAGEKRWRIYANRAENPLDTLEGPDAQARIDAAKGPVLMEVMLRPGDVLYIPRGYFHDALASSAESLHLTVSVAPPSGRLLLQLLEEAALRDPAFRAYLPDAREAGGAALAERLAALGSRLAEIAASPGIGEAIANRQRRLRDRPHPIALPARPALDFHARTQRGAEVLRRESGAVLRVGDTDHPLGVLSDAAEFLLGRPAFSVQELRARYPHHDVGELDALVATAVRLGLCQAYRPKL